MPSPFFGHGVGPVAMEDTEVEFLGFREMGHTGHECLPERPIIGPFGKDFVDGRVVNGRFPSGVCWHRQALPLHPCVEHPQDAVKDAMIAQFALWPALGHGEVRQDKCLELRCGELDRDWRRYRLWCCGAHHARASWEEG